MSGMDASSLQVEWVSVTMNSASITHANPVQRLLTSIPSKTLPYSSDAFSGCHRWKSWRRMRSSKSIQGLTLGLRPMIIQSSFVRGPPGPESTSTSSVFQFDFQSSVISSRCQSETDAQQITSFHGRSLEQRFGRHPASKTDQKRISWYLPIALSQYHPRSLHNKNGLGTPRISIENGKRMTRNSFINVHTVYAINRKYLRSYSGLAYRGATEHFLDQSSVKAMWAWSKRLTQYSPGPQYLVRQQRPFQLHQPVVPRALSKTREKTQTQTPPVPPVQPGRAEAGPKCPFLILLKAASESPNTARQALRSGRIPLGLALGVVAVILWVLGLLMVCLHMILKLAHWGIRVAVRALE